MHHWLVRVVYFVHHCVDKTDYLLSCCFNVTVVLFCILFSAQNVSKIFTIYFL